MWKRNSNRSFSSRKRHEPLILDEIIRNKKKEVALSKRTRSLRVLQEETRRLPRRTNNFIASLKNRRGMAVIAEIKRRSPSKGLLRKDFNPVSIARAYAASGAAALSVLTDEKYFGGSAEILGRVKKAVSLPVLRKDFIIDEYQVHESRLMKADAILLIARVLDKAALKRFYILAKKLELEVLFEVHDEADLKKVIPLRPRLIGFNNRDLSNFKVDLGVTRRLAAKVSKGCILVSESGIAKSDDLRELKRYGVRAVLVGELLMKDKKPGEALKRLLGKSRG